MRIRLAYGLHSATRPSVHKPGKKYFRPPDRSAGPLLYE